MDNLNFTPKHQMITEYFRDMIISGQVQPGARLNPDSEVAQRFKVNTRTVAKGMSQLVADGLITRTPGRGSVVLRKDIVGRNSNAVGVVAFSSGHIFRDMAAEITEGLLKHDSYPVWITQSIFHEGIRNPNYSPFVKMVEHFVNECPQGMIVEGERFMPFDLIGRNLGKFRNLVFIMSYLRKEKLPARYILVDYREGGREAARCFYRNGHRRIVFLPYVQPLREGYEKTVQEVIYEGLQEEFTRLGGEVVLSFYERVVAGEPLVEAVREEWGATRFTGLLAAYDALWINKAAPVFKDLGLRVPADISVIGFNNTPWCESTAPRLSSFAIHEKQIARIAVQMLYDEIQSKDMTLNPELIERESVKDINGPTIRKE